MKKGEVMSIEQRRKMSQSRLGKYGGEKNPNWGGGRWTDKDGYIMIYAPNHPFVVNGKYVREHRLVMEKHIGRFLTPKEIVHHLNGKRDDNRLENLVLIPNHRIHISEKNSTRHRNKKGQFTD